MKNKVLEIINQMKPEPVDQILIENIRDSLVLDTQPVPDSEIKIGQSKIGGMPDVPENFVWPEWNKKPQSFIAQINLEEVPDFEDRKLLPKKGLLSFFYSSEQDTWGFDPKDKGSWKVKYFSNTVFNRKEFPIKKDEEGIFNPCAVNFKQSITVPDSESPHFKSFTFRELFDSKISEVRDAVTELTGDDWPENRLFGHPDQVQRDMMLECQLASNGLYCGNATGYNDPRAKELEPGAMDWILLLQIKSDNNAGMMWGDVGALFFWIRKQDLAARNFDAVWMILQCG